MSAASNPLARLAQTSFALERAAVALVGQRVAHTAMVVVVRPDEPDATVIAHDDHIGLRAAVRVAAAAGNDRLWRSAMPLIERVQVDLLPPVVQLAAKRDRTRICHIAGLYRGDRPLAVVLWFSRRERDTAAATAYRNDTLAILQSATRADRAES